MNKSVLSIIAFLFLQSVIFGSAYAASNYAGGGLGSSIKSINKTRCVITIEDGTIINGLGTAIKELIIDENLKDIKIKSFAYPDEFIKHGQVDELEKTYHQDEETIYEYILKLKKKNEKEENAEESKEETDK